MRSTPAGDRLSAEQQHPPPGRRLRPVQPDLRAHGALLSGESGAGLRGEHRQEHSARLARAATQVRRAKPLRVRGSAGAFAGLSHACAVHASDVRVFNRCMCKVSQLMHLMVVFSEKLMPCRTWGCVTFCCVHCSRRRHPPLLPKPTHRLPCHVTQRRRRLRRQVRPVHVSSEWGLLVHLDPVRDGRRHDRCGGDARESIDCDGLIISAAESSHGLAR